MPASLEELREAFTLTNGSNLVPKIIDRSLLELVRKFAPLRQVLPRKTWSTQTYVFNNRAALPKAQATTEAPSTTDVAATASTYNQKSFDIKHLQAQLDISKFTAQVAIANGDLYQLELAGAAKSYVWLEEMFHLYGSTNGTLNTKRPQWDGFDMLTASANKLDGGTSLVTLSMLDSLIDVVKTGVATYLNNGDWFFLVTPKMASRINSLFVQQQRFGTPMKLFARDDYGIPGAAIVDQIGIDAGLEVVTYRGIPIVESSFLDSIGTMTTVTASDGGGSGSSLTNSLYSYIVEAVTEYGITAPCAEATVTPTSGHNVSLSWTTPTITDVSGSAARILSYRIFRTAAAGASGSESLYAVVSALDNTDTAITSWTDTGLIQDPTATGSYYWTTVAKSGSNAAPDGVTFPRVITGSQVVSDIFLIPRDPEFAVVPVVNEMRTEMLAPVNARTRQFALTGDQTFALRAPTYAAKLGRVRSA